MGALTRQDHVHPLRQNEAWHRQAQTYLARLAKDEDGVYRTYGQWGNMVYLRIQYAWVSRTLTTQSYSVTLGVATVTKRLAVTIAEPYTSLRVSTVLEAPARG